MAEKIYSYQQLFDFTEKIFLHIGCPSEQAALATEVLLNADLRGIDSHGVARLSGYVRLWEAKRVNAQPNIRIIHETPSTAVVDGDSGLGLVVAPFAMQVAIEKAKKVGTGWVSVQNSNHFGIAGYHAMMALEYEMIGMAMTNASPLVAPTFSTERLLGTNPICVSIPAGEEPADLVAARPSGAVGRLGVSAADELECLVRAAGSRTVQAGDPRLWRHWEHGLRAPYPSCPWQTYLVWR